MSTQKGQNRCPQCKMGYTSENQKNVQSLSRAQGELLEFADALDGPDLVQSLKLVHDMALYDSYGLIDGPEKNALYATKCLWERIEAIVQDSETSSE